MGGSDRPRRIVVTAFDLTTSCELFSPERLFAVVGELNARAGPGGPIGIELYPTRHSPLTPLSVERVIRWQERHGAKVVRVHVEFVYDRAEIRHIIRCADRQRGLYTRLLLRALYWFMADASAGLGLRLARGLGVGVNVHSNVIATLARRARLASFAAGLPFVWAENNIKANYLYVRGPVLYDPRVIVEQQVEPYELDGLLLGLDHLIDHYATQRISPYDVLEDPRVQAWTRALHVAAPHHGIIRVGDPGMAALFAKLSQTPFRHPVRLALDYSATAMLRHSFREEVRLFGDTFAWIQGLLAA